MACLYLLGPDRVAARHGPASAGPGARHPRTVAACAPRRGKQRRSEGAQRGPATPDRPSRRHAV